MCEQTMTRWNIGRVIALCLLGMVVLIRPISGCAARPLIEHGNISFDISPDDQTVVFVAADDDLYLLHLKTLHVSRLTTTVAKERAPAFSPDGKFIAYSAEAGGKNNASLFVRSLDGKQVRQLTKDPMVSDLMPSYSPDGSNIVFARAHRLRRYRGFGDWTWYDWDLYTMKSDGSQVVRVTQQKSYRLSPPRFQPDGSNIVYSTQGQSQDLLVVEASGKKQPAPLINEIVRSAQGGAWVSQPDVSSAGDSIAFISDRVKSYWYDVFIIDHDDTAPRPLRLTRISRYNQQPRFFASGRHLLFLAGTEWNAESRPIFSLWQVNIDGKNPRRIAGSGLFTNPLKWKLPD
jgi:Tol biopolymer transport system component